MPDTVALEDRVGEVVREVIFPVEAGKIAEFARAMRDDNPVYFTEKAAQAAGFGAVPAPLTFAVASALYAGGNATDLPVRLGFDLSRTVHGEERWVYHRPIEAGMVLTGTTRISEVTRKSGRSGEMLMLWTETEYVDQAGEPILTELSLTMELPAR